MRIFKTLLAVIALIGVTACATPPGYTEYLSTQEKISADNKASANVKSIALQKMAAESTDPTVKAVAVMMLGMGGSNNTSPLIAPPQNQALEWFKAATPLLGNVTQGGYAYSMQKDNNKTQVEMYSTQMGAFTSIASQGLSTAETLGSKDPLVFFAEPAAPVAAE